MRKRWKIRACVLLAVFIFMGGCGRAGEEKLNAAGMFFLEGTDSVPGEAGGDEGAESAPEICVFVCGAVKEPGVYYLPAGSRVYEAIGMAGGLTEDADPGAVNQAEPLKDGEQVTICTKAEMLAEGGKTDGGKVNINTADVSGLTQLSGIGESRAEDIIAYRNKHGAFSVPEDIMKVPGIKEAVFEKIKDGITVG